MTVTLKTFELIGAIRGGGTGSPLFASPRDLAALLACLMRLLVFCKPAILAALIHSLMAKALAEKLIRNNAQMLDR